MLASALGAATALEDDAAAAFARRRGGIPTGELTRAKTTRCARSRLATRPRPDTKPATWRAVLARPVVVAAHMMPASPPTAPTALLLLLVAKHAFVQANLDAGKVPTSAMLAAFLQALVAQ